MADMAAVGGLNPRQGYCCSVAAAPPQRRGRCNLHPSARAPPPRAIWALLDRIIVPVGLCLRRQGDFATRLSPRRPSSASSLETLAATTLLLALRLLAPCGPASCALALWHSATPLPGHPPASIQLQGYPSVHPSSILLLPARLNPSAPHREAWRPSSNATPTPTIPLALRPLACPSIADHHRCPIERPPPTVHRPPSNLTLRLPHPPLLAAPLPA
ncbi:hypothetical protein GRF29_112g796707 [Pseudopithomyces chartarum]|uniref:Uncharacterized protein n=1 Tax=Pseudopithomyces chartarum TaxID=1892770 RepID=A0AAN6LW18_9PLEO|nr:hypothetical protein GRF29_112g796707 [Pseudopithomyces chartarum]